MDSLYSDSSRSRTEDLSSNTNDDEYINTNGYRHRVDELSEDSTLLHSHNNTNGAGYGRHSTATNGTASSYYDQDEEDEEEITPAELIEQLQQSWLNEKFAPELLDHKTAVVECIIEQIKHMESNIMSAKKGDFRIAIHKLEVTFCPILFFVFSFF